MQYSAAANVWMPLILRRAQAAQQWVSHASSLLRNGNHLVLHLLMLGVLNWLNLSARGLQSTGLLVSCPDCFRKNREGKARDHWSPSTWPPVDCQKRDEKCSQAQVKSRCERDVQCLLTSRRSSFCAKANWLYVFSSALFYVWLWSCTLVKMWGTEIIGY